MYALFYDEKLGAYTEKMGLLSEAKATTNAPGIMVDTVQIPYEADSFGNDYDKNATASASKTTVKISSVDEFDRGLRVEQTDDGWSEN